MNLTIILFVGDSQLPHTIKRPVCYLGDFDARFGVRALTVAKRLAEGDTSDVWPELSRVSLHTNNLEVIDVILQSEACSVEVYKVRDGQWREFPAELARRLRFERGVDIRQLTTYEVVVAGIEEDNEIDELIESMIKSGAHEGNDFDGWSTTLI